MTVTDRGHATGVRLLAPWQDRRAADDLRAHHWRHGPVPGPDLATLVEIVDAAGLRGRGGGGFPTARKLRAVGEARSGGLRRRKAVVVANACEGEPDSAKDAALLHCSPHLVLDGLTIAAQALDARQAVLCVRAGARHDTLSTALAERRDPVPIRIERVPDRYVASEESALVRYLSGGPALPRSTPPRPAERGVDKAPTLVDNVETLAHLALIARYGHDWFRTVGTPDLPGTLLATVAGAVSSPGVVEIPAGSPVRDVIDLAGGPTTTIQAVLCGGYGGAWLPAHAIDTPMTHASLDAAGSVLGVPILRPLPSAACGLAYTARLVRYLVEQSAGQCGPCQFGLPALAADLEAIAVGGVDSAAAYTRLTRRLPLVAGRGACAHPDGAVRLVNSALRVFGADLRSHLDRRPCPSATPYRLRR